MKTIWNTLSLLLATFLVAPLLTAARVTSVDMDPVQGEVVGCDDRQRVLLKLAGSETDLPIAMDGIESIEFAGKTQAPDAASAPLRLVLADASVLYGSILDSEEEASDRFPFKPAGLPKIDIDAYNVIRFENRSVMGSAKDALPKGDDSQMDIWKIYRADGDVLECEIDAISSKGVQPYIEGVGGLLYGWSRVRSMTHRRSAPEASRDLMAIAMMKNGNLLKGKVKSWKEGKLTLQTQFDQSIEIPQTSLASIIFQNGRFVYLSDIEPTKADEYPYFRAEDFDQKDHLFKYRKDRAQGGGVLTMKGKRYAKGLGVHAISKLTYAPERRFTKFVAEIGIDDSASEMASVEFKLLVDGKERKFQLTSQSNKESKPVEVTTTGKLKKSNGVFRVELNIAGASEVTLIVLAADNADVGDRANWANAKFIR